MQAHMGRKGLALLIINLSTRWGGWTSPIPGLFTSRKETRCPLYRRLGGPRDRSRGARKTGIAI